MYFVYCLLNHKVKENRRTGCKEFILCCPTFPLLSYMNQVYRKHLLGVIWGIAHCKSVHFMLLSLETKAKDYIVIFLCKLRKLGNIFPKIITEKYIWLMHSKQVRTIFTELSNQNTISKVCRWKSFSKIRIGKLGCVLEKFTWLDGGVSATTTSFVWNTRVHLTNFSTLQRFTNQFLWKTLAFMVEITTTKNIW